IGCARFTGIVEQRSTTQHTIISGIHVLSPITYTVGIRHKETTGPLPDIASHVLRATRAGAARITTNWRRSTFAALFGIAAGLIEAVAPGVDTTITATRRLLPLRLARQAPRLACGPSQPDGVGHCVVPGDVDNRIVELAELVLPAIRLVL